MDSIQLEISSLKLSHDATALEYFTAVFKALLSLIKSLSATAAPGPAGGNSICCSPVRLIWVHRI